MPGSCNSGFRSRPSAAAGSKRSKGFDVISMNSRKSSREQSQHRQDARHEDVRQAAAEARHGHRPDVEHQDPEQKRSLVPAPDCGDPIGQWQCRVGIGRNIKNRKVVPHERRCQANERQRNQYKLQIGRGPRQRNPVVPAALRAGQRDDALHERHSQGQEQDEVTQFGDHLLAPGAC